MYRGHAGGRARRSRRHGLMPNYAGRPSQASGDAVRSALSAGDVCMSAHQRDGRTDPLTTPSIVPLPSPTRSADENTLE